MVTRLVFGKNDEMPSALVRLAFLLMLGIAPARHIHLTSEDGFEGLQPLCLPLFVYTIYIVEKFLYTEHVSMIRDSHSTHSVLDSLIHQMRY